MKKSLIIVLMFLLIIGCKNSNKEDLFGIYTTDKVPYELSDDKEYHYLILEEGIYYLKYNDINKKGIKSSWKIIDKTNDTLIIQFRFYNKDIIGKFKNNSFIFENPNVFDKRFSVWLYTKTSLNSDDIYSRKSKN